MTDIGRLSIDPYLAEGKGLSTEELDDLFIQMRDAVYHIIQAKGATLRYRHGMVRLTRLFWKMKIPSILFPVWAQGKCGCRISISDSLPSK
ncbi:hypothetical protein [Melghirimyces thermohalophilus]|uniref:hypothetical protein n=1 Tax=Melghirimyces thermohalophilus TaxID=1236220 RepID=UPI00316ABFAE